MASDDVPAEDDVVQQQARRRLLPPALPERATVDVFPRRDVTRVGQEDRTTRGFLGIWREVARLYRTGLHPAIALHIVHQGQVVLDRSIGHLENVPWGPTGAIATPDSLYNLFSASKIVTAALVHALIDDGVLGLDDRVVDTIPELAGRGRERIRLRHLLSHTAGIPRMPAGLDLETLLEAGHMPVAELARIEPVSSPGARVAYHPMSAWFIVQELIERRTGEQLRPLLRRRLLDPLGLQTLDYGVRPNQVDQVAKHALTGPPAPGLMARIFERTVGVDLDRAVALTNDARFLTAVLPSANVIGTPRDVSRFLGMLLRGGQLDGTRVLSRQAVTRMTTAATPRQFDGTFGFPMRYGLGVMMGGRRFSLFGLDTAGAFGHLGLSTVVVYADPARDLVVTFLNTGKPMMDLGMVRWYWVLQRIASMVPRG